MNTLVMRRSGEPVSTRKLVLGFIAGFFAVLLFHQPVVALLAQMGVIKAGVYAMSATAPFGVPQVISLSFWGGVWGILFALVEHRFPRGPLYWVYAFAFGAIFPTLVAWFIVSPLKHAPVAGGWQAGRMVAGLLANGAWGAGTALLFAVASRFRRAV
jgi:hypothetical protein